MRDPTARALAIAGIVLVAAAVALGIIGIILPRGNKTGVTVTHLAPSCPAGGINVTFCEDRTGDGECTAPDDVVYTSEVVCNGDPTPVLAPIQGFVVFWWDNPSFGLKAGWGMVEPFLGRTLGAPIGYAVTENRVSGAKLQYGRGETAHSIASVVQTSISSKTYLVQHDVAVPSYTMVELQAPPDNHTVPEVVTYDALHSRMLAILTLTGPSRYGVATINTGTGEIVPLTGYDGAAAPVVSQVLDVFTTHDRIVIFNRNDQEKGFAQFFDRTTGQYTGFSTFNGTLIPYPNTFLQTWLTAGFDFWWIQSVGYDAANSRLHLLIGAGGGESDRSYGWIQAASDADMAAQLQSGNYDIHMTQNQPDHIINAAAWIPPQV